MLLDLLFGGMTLLFSALALGWEPKRAIVRLTTWKGRPLWAPTPLVPFPHPRTIDAALANLTALDDSTEAFQDRLQAAEEENNV